MKFRSFFQDKRVIAGHGLVMIFVTAVAYYVTGKLGLSLAVPPGFATAVFPASGIGLVALLLGGYRLAIGIFIGSLFINLPLDFGFTERDVAIAATIAFGAALQAVVSRFLIEKLVTDPFTLNRAKDILLFLALGSIVGCLVSASWGVSWLMFFGVIDSDSFFHSWFTWYIGDVIGAMIFVPLGLIMFGGVVGQNYRRKFLLSLPLIFSFALTVLVYLYVSRLETNRVKRSFHSLSDKIFSEIDKKVSNDHSLLLAMNAFFDSSQQVDADEFSTFGQRIVVVSTSVRAFAWFPAVYMNEKRNFQADFKATYVEPLRGNESLADGDFFATPQVRQAFISACENKNTSTKRFEKTTGDPAKLLFIRPIFDRQAMASPKGCEDVKGFVVAVLDVGELILSAISSFQLENLELVVTSSGAGESSKVFGFPNGAINDFAQAEVKESRTLSSFGLIWQIQTLIPNSLLWKEKSMTTWFVLFFGMLFTGLLTAFVLILAGRQRILEEEVDAAEKKIKQQLQRVGEEARLSSLGQMAGGVAHEINTPLAIIRAQSDIMLMKLDRDGFSSEEVRNYAQKTIRVVERIAKITTGLRVIARDGSKEECKLYPVQALVEETLSVCSEKFKMNGVTVETIIPEGIKVFCNYVQVCQVLINLLNNSFYAIVNESEPWIEISAFLQGEVVFISVTDSGRGIKKEIAEKIFEPFFTTKPIGEGTGLGLIVSRELIRSQGGKLYFDQSAAHTRFIVEIPARAGSQAERRVS